MKKMKSYILPILFFTSFVFNFSTINCGMSLKVKEETREALIALSRESCRSLLLLGTGIAGLILITGTIRHIINNEKETCQDSPILTSLLNQVLSVGRHGLGIGTGALFLGAGFWGLNSKVNFNKLFGSKMVPSCLRQESKPEEKQD